MIGITETEISGAVIVEPRVFADLRGYFMETFSARDFSAAVAPIEFVQDNESRSQHGVMRGLHFQRPPFAQSKLVRCVAGEILDVAVDIRRQSPTFGRHVAVRLSADNKRQLFLPKGMAHGFAVLSSEAVVQYKCDEFYHPEAEAGIDMFDPALDIDWPFTATEAILSAKDTVHPRFESLLFNDIQK